MFPSEPTVHDANVVLTVADPFEMFSKGNRFNPLVMSDTAAELPIIQDKIPPARRLTARLATPARVLGVVLLLVLIRLQPAPRNSDSSTKTGITLQQVQDLLPNAAKIGPSVDGIQTVTDAEDNVVGQVCQTQPAANKVTGYRGITNLLILLNEELEVTRVSLLESEDTEEHAAAVRKDQKFLSQFAGWKMGQQESFESVDATSGATLTALAAIQSVSVRLGSDAPSLKFPNPLTVADLELLVDVLPDETVEGLTIRKSTAWSVDVLDADRTLVGRLIRTGPLSDRISGYQGPTELVTFCDTNDQVLGIRLRETWENQPYAGYLNDEPWFWSPLENKPFAELRLVDLVEEEVEGVSGATMTSMASAETMLAAAAEYHRRLQTNAGPPVQESTAVRWTAHDTGTVAVLLVGILIGMTRLRGIKWIRRTWFVILIGYFGIVTGNLLSLAVVSAWSFGGIAWQMAPGMAAVIIVSLLLPPASRRNIYCTHLCPHGALQQLLRHLRWRWKSGRRLLSRLRFLPGLILVAAATITILQVPWNLAAWEPFDAWIWYIAGPASLILAAVSVVLSAVVPMAWCRYACGTGRLLEYLRHSAQAAKFQMADAALVGLILLVASRYVG